MSDGRFTFLEIYLDDAEDMTAEEKGEYLEAVIQYGLYGTVSEHKASAVKIAFRHAKKLIDAASAKKEAMRKLSNSRWNKSDDDAEVMHEQCASDAEAMRTQCMTDAEPMRDPCVRNAQRMQNKNENKRESKSKIESKDKDEDIKENQNTKGNITLSPSSPSSEDTAAAPPGEREDAPIDEFERFWEAYPRKEAKANAKKAWMRARLDGVLDLSEIDAIIAAVDKAKASRQWQQDSGRYIPLPANYISSARWKDEGTDKSPEDKKFENFLTLALQKAEADLGLIAGGT